MTIRVLVGEAADGDEVVALTRVHHPDIVVMDIRMPGTDGRTATSAICSDPVLSDTRVLILTTFETEEHVARALHAGASGFLGKDVGAEGLVAGIRTIAAGDALLSPQATRNLITRFLTAPQPGTHPAARKNLADLTDREREVMALAADGLTNADIAARLYLSPLTVRTHIHHAMAKLHARDRAQLVVIAYQTGLVQPNPPRP
ncbi:response regulator transcription factor [Streptomyces phaeolivaceus]|uniref:Response regulator transcription factor n=1 Tax=Streptomyces phaeolivaceus TaxID=2653200 RepID=A0A5P8JZ07_9ACTN|nr:response regulator transcription factor [Streptomyces phaeolivaceus]QFQ95659.1 response regulator transcription factor [Streptomyces phaeolivaceus]